MACKGLLRGLSESAQSAVVLRVVAGPTALHPANSASGQTVTTLVGGDRPVINQSRERASPDHQGRGAAAIRHACGQGVS
ncbi:hypothetical protein [Candidatus Chloroploca sp. Khr17]|uniref:hypothetical protein n=1 Tax=Candidatus Chloroploca sp. Khr17 TaxID=2496869 RepID=UPI00101DD77B|nr:hypothetical protein [Candidatus Chloroploca sp. Khr17]